MIEVERELWGRLVAARVATRGEIEASWSLGDLFLAHLALDYRDELDRRMLPSKPKGKTK